MEYICNCPHCGGQISIETERKDILDNLAIENMSLAELIVYRRRIAQSYTNIKNKLGVESKEAREAKTKYDQVLNRIADISKSPIIRAIGKEEEINEQLKGE